MPLYEYECEKCGQRFERIQKFSDPPVDKCPSCEGTVRKLLSSPAIQFKGSGWYITDYAKKGGVSKGSGAEKSSDGRDKADKTDKGDSSASTEKTEKSSDKPASSPATGKSE
jgi:putative FmdB family regulatory protein